MQYFGSFLLLPVFIYMGYIGKGIMKVKRVDNIRDVISKNKIGLSENYAKTLNSIFSEVDKYDSQGNEVNGGDGNLNLKEWKSFCAKVRSEFEDKVANKIITEVLQYNDIKDINPFEDIYEMPADKTYYAHPFVMEIEPEEPVAEPIDKEFTKNSPIKTNNFVDKEKFGKALNNLLKSKGKTDSKLIDLGSDIVDIAGGMSTDPFLVAAISIQESGWGCSPAAKECNNLMGINDYAKAKKKKKHFVPRDYEDNPLASIKTGVNTLDTRVSEGYETFTQVAYSGRYCAKDESAGWENNVLNIANQLRKEYNKLF